MLFFIDETWQELGDGQRIGALGAVALPQESYNDFWSAVFAMKRDLLGAQELSDSEIKGARCFAKAAFKRQELHGDSHWLAVAGSRLRRVVDRDDRLPRPTCIASLRAPRVAALRGTNDRAPIRVSARRALRAHQPNDPTSPLGQKEGPGELALNASLEATHRTPGHSR